MPNSSIPLLSQPEKNHPSVVMQVLKRCAH